MGIAVIANNAWGTLRGVRPTKLVHAWYDQGCSDDQIAVFLRERYAVSPPKVSLLMDVVKRQIALAGFVHSLEEIHGRAVSAYIGIPYCLSRCVYCSFIAQVRPADERCVQELLRALFYDIAAAGVFLRSKQSKIQTLYIGGGTPTALTATELDSLLSVAKKELPMQDGAEITVEAGRADSLDTDKIALFKEYGVNRVAINPQTVHDRTLRAIGRGHNCAEFLQAVEILQRQNCFALSMDVIAGLPGESRMDFLQTLNTIMALRPENLTVHNLAIKQGSELKKQVLAGGVIPAALYSEREKEIAAMIDEAYIILSKQGYAPYYLYRQKYTAAHAENIGYSLPGCECLYNVQVMEERQDIVGMGSGAMSKRILSLRREEKKSLKNFHFPKDVVTYMKNIKEGCNKREAIFDDLD